MYVTASPQLSNVLKVDPDRNMAGKRVYQLWKGSNRFFLNGRLIFGPDVRSLLATIVLIVAPIVVFCVFVAKHLMDELPHHAGIAIMVIAVVHTFGILVLLLLTSGRDPGIIPRNLHPPEAEEEVDSPSDWSGGQTPRSRLPRTKDVIVNGVTVKIKYCDTCMLYRPPRCSHCSICNNCVERFDHHCPWVGQCVGRRNYPFFFMFVFSTTILCFYIFAMCGLRIKKLMEGDPPHTVWKALQRSPASTFLMAYAFLATWFVGGLTVFHMYLTSTNQTTYENFRYRYDNKLNPYNRGVVHNIREILCSRIPPSKNKFRAKVQRDMMTPTLNDRKVGGDVELDVKAGWTSMVGSELPHDVHGQSANNVGVSKELKQGCEVLAEALGRAIPTEGRDIKGGVNARRSSWGRRSGNWEISPEILALSSAVDEEVSHGNGQSTPASNR